MIAWLVFNRQPTKDIKLRQIIRAIFYNRLYISGKCRFRPCIILNVYNIFGEWKTRNKRNSSSSLRLSFYLSPYSIFPGLDRAGWSSILLPLFCLDGSLPSFFLFSLEFMPKQHDFSVKGKCLASLRLTRNLFSFKDCL